MAIAIVYENATAALQGFSQIFLNAIEAGDRTICLIADSPHPTIPTFSPQDPHLIKTIMTWLQQTILED